MSWLTEKFWSGKKQRIASCTIDDTLAPIDYEANYYQSQLKNFMANGQSVITEIVSYEVLNEVSRYAYLRKSSLSTRSQSSHLAGSTLLTRDIQNLGN
jgi:hypothetical protein